MTNLPIMPSTAQAATPSKQAANTTDSADTQNSQPFGQVLARQLDTPASKEAKADDKLATDVLAQLGIDTLAGKKDAADSKKDAGTESGKTDAPAATDATTTLPADMLAALLPQALNTPAATTTASSKSDGTAVAAGTGQDRQPIGTLRADTTATAQTDTAPRTTPGLNAAPQAREQSFAAALDESANRNANVMELRAAAREAVTAAIAAQPSSATTLAAMQNNAANIAASGMQPAQLTVNTPVAQDRWADEFSQKITWLASSKQDQTAELHLNPPQLGPVDVVIKVSGDQATALFTSPHAAVRDAIEQAMPRLRDMMADNGIMLGNATVSDQAPRDQGQQANTQRTSTSTGNDARDASVSSITAARVSQISRHNGIVDTFA